MYTKRSTDRFNINNVNYNVNGKCRPCAMAKYHKFPYDYQIDNNVKQPLELIHSDLCGEITAATFDGYRHIS